ncbi:MAG: HNH endonuclease [Rhodobacteraceae bacterium]|nr:HNH endonuclease [Paracoccaceae bacterium]
MVKISVMVTDNDWFEFLRNEHLKGDHGLSKVNFWNPSGKSFTNHTVGELVLFKLKAPVNKIAGGGIFSNFLKLPWKLAWDTFGYGNGADSADKMYNMVSKLRTRTSSDSFEIGCTILSDPFFLDEENYLSPPQDWKAPTVVGKNYDTAEDLGLTLWQEVQPLLWTEPEDGQIRYGPPQLILPRLGQGGFRSLIRTNYNNRCAITNEKTLPVLEAAHIKPYNLGGKHEPSNGILFRSDIHKLFDSGYVTVNSDYKFEVSHRIRQEFENGRDYYALHGKNIFVPSENGRIPPDTGLLEWHNNNCYKG